MQKSTVNVELAQKSEMQLCLSKNLGYKNKLLINNVLMVKKIWLILIPWTLSLWPPNPTKSFPNNTATLKS